MSKRDNKNNKKAQAKVKQPMTLAKDKNQLIMAGVVLILFVISVIYNVGVYIKEQQPVEPTQVEAASADPITRDLAAKGQLQQPPAASNGAATPGNPSGNPSTNPSMDPISQNIAAQSGQSQKVVGADGVVKSASTSANQSVEPEEGSVNWLTPILIIVLIVGIVLLIIERQKKKNGTGGLLSALNTKDLGASTSKSGKPGKFAFAKNKNEMILAGAVLLLFVGVTIYNIAIYMKNQQGSGGPVQKMDQAQMMAAKQQHNLESLGAPGSQNMQEDTDDIYSKTLSMQGPNPGSVDATNPAMQAAQTPTDEIEVMSKNGSRARSGKTVMVNVSETGRSNPFLPAAENIVPSSLPKFNILPPPEEAASGSDASNVISTTISGILYDKYSPSAIINIGGTDYLVKKGDTINRYKVLSIGRDQVTVQLGSNVYRAGVGQILSQGTMNYNTISNLDKKFGGNNVSIGVRKKGY